MSNKKSEDMVGHDPLAWIEAVAEELEPEEVEAKKEALVEVGTKELEAQVESVEDGPVASQDIEVVAQEKTEVANLKAKSESQGMVVVFEGDLGIAQVADMHKRLTAVLLTTSEFSLDMSEVSHVDTSSLQVLCAFVCDANKLNATWHWQGVPESVTKTANALGLSEALDLEA